MRLFILGAADPEMAAIESLLADRGEQIAYAVGPDGDRVVAGNAYRAIGYQYSDDMSLYTRFDGDVVLVECGGDLPAPAVVVDHHWPGDPGYGQPPAAFAAASSIGQVLALLYRNAQKHERDGLVSFMSDEQLLIAAADHCLAAAYRGECPGVDPDALMRWRVESRAAFQKRSADDVLRDVEAARTVLRDAEVLHLSAGIDAGGVCRSCRVKCAPTEEDGSWDYCECPTARDMRGRKVAELPEASAREGLCFISDGLPDPTGRVKVVCQSGTPEQIRAFMAHWAPAAGLVDVYGDPARGFAGGYVK